MAEITNNTASLALDVLEETALEYGERDWRGWVAINQLRREMGYEPVEPIDNPPDDYFRR